MTDSPPYPILLPPTSVSRPDCPDWKQEGRSSGYTRRRSSCIASGQLDNNISMHGERTKAPRLLAKEEAGTGEGDNHQEAEPCHMGFVSAPSGQPANFKILA